MSDLIPVGTSAPALTAVIVHRALPETCIRTGRALLDQGIRLRLVVVDNGSPAGDLATLRGGLPEAEVIELGRNTGFGPAANVGLRRWLAAGAGGGDWAVVCPHDALPEPGCLALILSEVARRPRAGLACAEYGDVGHYGEAGPVTKPVVDPWLGGVLAPSVRRRGWEDAGYPHGTLLFAGRACLNDIGLFDEDYFAYCEEADLGERARRAGWGVGIVWGAVVRNTGMTSEAGVPEYLMLRNTLHLVRRHFGRTHALFLFGVSAWITVRGTLLPRRRPPYWHPRARRLALRDFVLGRLGPPPRALTAPPGRSLAGP